MESRRGRGDNGKESWRLSQKQTNMRSASAKGQTGHSRLEEEDQEAWKEGGV